MCTIVIHTMTDLQKILLHMISPGIGIPLGRTSATVTPVALETGAAVVVPLDGAVKKK